MKNQTLTALLAESATLAARRARITARIEAANARHALHTPAVILLDSMTPTAVDALINLADVKVSHQLRNLGRNGNPVIMRLQGMRAETLRMYYYHKYVEAADHARTEHKEQSKKRNDHKTKSRRIRSTDSERTAHLHASIKAASMAKAAIDNARTIEGQEPTSNDRSDLTQTAIEAMLTHGQHARNIGNIIAEAVRNHKAGSAFYRTYTDIVRPATDEDKQRHSTYTYTVTDPTTGAKEHRRVYEAQPYITRRGVQDGYSTIEHRKAATDKHGHKLPEGDYLIRHYQTTPTFISFESCMEGGMDFPATNEGMNAVLTYWDRVRIERLFDTAKLNELERIIARYVADNVTKAAVLAKADRDGETDTALIERLWKEALCRAYVDEADQAETKAAIEIKLSGKDGMRVKRLKAKLAKARQEMEAAEAMPPMPDTKPAPMVETISATLTVPVFQPIARTISRTKDTRTEAERRAGREYAEQGVKWLTDYPTPQAISAEEAAQADQAHAAYMQEHKADRIRIDYRRRLRDCTRMIKVERYTQDGHGLTPYTIRTEYTQSAEAAASVFFEAMTADEQTAAAMADHDLTAARKAAIADIRSKYPTLAQWRLMTAEERTQWAQATDAERMTMTLPQITEPTPTDYIREAAEILPKEIKRLDTLTRRAAEAEAEAAKAQAIADRFPRRRYKTDPADSHEAIAARQAAAEAERRAAEAKRRAEEQRQTVERYRRTVSK